MLKHRINEALDNGETEPDMVITIGGQQIRVPIIAQTWEVVQQFLPNVFTAWEEE